MSLETLQIDKREDDDSYGGVDFDMSPRVVRALVGAWPALQTLDLYNITPKELPSEVKGFVPLIFKGLHAVLHLPR